jgi:2'-5' RNA ligase
LRCFVGAFLEPDCAARLSRLAPKIEGFTPVVPENLHVTLLFLGELTEEQAHETLKQVQTLGAGPLRCELMAITGLPQPSRAAVLVAELHPHRVLTSWRVGLTERVGPADRPFLPHVTLARSRRPRSVTVQPVASRIYIQLRPPALYLSETLSGGARYSEISFS